MINVVGLIHLLDKLCLMLRLLSSLEPDPNLHDAESPTLTLTHRHRSLGQCGGWVGSTRAEITLPIKLGQL